MNTKNKWIKSSKLSMTDIKNLCKKLNNLMEYLDLEFAINCGGCCYISYILSNLFESNDIPYKLIIFTDEIEDAESLNDIKYTQYHYCLQVYNIMINLGDCCEDDFYLELKTNSKELYSYYNKNKKKRNWNSCYDSNKNKFISNTIRKFYNEFIKDLC